MANSMKFVVTSLPVNDDKLFDCIKDTVTRPTRSLLAAAAAAAAANPTPTTMPASSFASSATSSSSIANPAKKTNPGSAPNISDSHATSQIQHPPRAGSLDARSGPGGPSNPGSGGPPSTVSNVPPFAASRVNISPQVGSVQHRQVARRGGRMFRHTATRGRAASVIMSSGSRVIPAQYVPEELINQAQVVLQGKPRSVIVRELQRTNLDVNSAVNNLLPNTTNGKQRRGSGHSYSRRNSQSSTMQQNHQLSNTCNCQQTSNSNPPNGNCALAHANRRPNVSKRYKPVTKKNIYSESDFFHDGIMEYIEYELRQRGLIE